MEASYSRPGTPTSLVLTQSQSSFESSDNSRSLSLTDGEFYQQAQEVNAVASFALGQGHQEDAERLEEAGDYALIPDQEEFHPEDYLEYGKVPLWFSSQMGGGGIGRAVDMTKEVDGTEKDQKPARDVDRQKQFDMAFARMKFALHLKDVLVNYDITRHSMVIYNKDGTIKGKYDLKEFGLSQDSSHHVPGGGGLNQLLLDNQITLTEDQIRALSDKLKGFNSEMQKIIAPELGERPSYTFEAGNKGNVQGLVPFIAGGDEGKKVLHEDGKYGFFLKTMFRLKLLTTESKRWPRKDVHLLNKEGSAALEDIEKATNLQKIIIYNIGLKRQELTTQIAALAPAYPTVPTEKEQVEVEALKKEVQQLNLVHDEIAGLSPGVSARMCALGAAITRLTPAAGAPSTDAQKEIDKYKAEMQQLTKQYRKTEGANATVLHLMLLELNSQTSVRHKYRMSSGRLIYGQTKWPAKEFLKPLREDDRPYFGVDKNDTFQADIVQNDLVDSIANTVATGFETTVSEEHSSRKRRDWFKSTPMELDPKNASHKEVQQIATNMGALVYDLGARISTDPIDARKAQFIEARPASEFARAARGLEFLIAATIFNGKIDIRGYGHESTTIRSIMETSLTQMKKEIIPHSQPLKFVDVSYDEVIQGILSMEDRMREETVKRAPPAA